MNFVEDKLSTRRDFDMAIRALFEQDSQAGPMVFSYVNPFSYYRVVGEPDFEVIDRWFADGALLCRLTNLFRPRDQKIDRTSFDFTSVAETTFEAASKQGLRVLLIGGTVEDATAAERYFVSRFSSIPFLRVLHGYGLAQRLDDIARMINEERVDIVVLGLGTPLQERTALDLSRRTTGRFFVTCGGFISQTAARGDYYHSWVKALGLRALQRIILEPHVRKRVMKDYPIFVARYLSARLSEKWSARRMGRSKP